MVIDLSGEEGFVGRLLPKENLAPTAPHYFPTVFLDFFAFCYEGPYIPSLNSISR